jgi:transposase InsO family protein
MVRSVIESGLSKAAAARQFNTTAKTVAKWVERFRAEGVDGLQDRSSRPLSLPSQTAPATCAVVEALRRQRYTGKQIAAEVGVSPATVSRILRRLGLNRMRDLEPAEPARRYEREHPGELIHIDIKKLGKFNRIGHRITGDRTGQSNARGIGWEFVHVCIDDCTRLAYVEILADERKETVTAFLKRAVGWFAERGVIIERLMTDNGSGYRSTLHRRACDALGIRHLFTRPYRPRTNGKAERFIRTLLADWAYQRPYATSAERNAALDAFLTRYNTQRPHRSLNGQTPIQRLAERNKTAAAYS